MIQSAVTQKGGVAPFGNPRIKGCSPLPAAYRSVPRPSSPLSAKASTRCPYLTLDRKEPHAQGQAPHATPLKTLMRNHDRTPARLAPIRRSRLRPRSHKNLFTMSINTGACFSRHRTRDLPQSDIELARTALLRQGFGGQPCSAGVVEANGIEPMTSCLQSRRSPS